MSKYSEGSVAAVGLFGGLLVLYWGRRVECGWMLVPGIVFVTLKRTFLSGFILTGNIYDLCNGMDTDIDIYSQLVDAMWV